MLGVFHLQTRKMSLTDEETHEWEMFNMGLNSAVIPLQKGVTVPIFFRLTVFEILPPLFRWTVTLKSSTGLRPVELIVSPEPSTHIVLFVPQLEM